MGFLPAGIEIKFEGIHPRCNSFQCSQKASFCSENGQYLVVDIGDGLSQCDLVEVDCKTVGFFLKISKEIGKVWRKSLTHAKRASITRP